MLDIREGTWRFFYSAAAAVRATFFYGRHNYEDVAHAAFLSCSFPFFLSFYFLFTENENVMYRVYRAVVGSIRGSILCIRRHDVPVRDSRGGDSQQTHIFFSRSRLEIGDEPRI